MCIPLNYYFAMAPFVYNTALSLFGQKSTNVAHLHLAIVFHSSLQKCFISLKLQGDFLCTDFFKLFHRFSKDLHLGSDWDIPKPLSSSEAILID